MTTLYGLQQTPQNLDFLMPNSAFRGLGTGANLSELDSMNNMPQDAGMGFGMNMPTARLGLGLLGSLGGLLGASNMNSLAKKQFKYAKRVTDTNLRNQATSYNTSLEDRIRSRLAAEARPQSEAEPYLDRNRMTY